MWNFSERTVQVRGLLIFVSIVLILSGLGFFLFTSLSGSTKAPANNQTATQLSPQTVDISPFVPVSSIGQLIKPCLFSFLKSCTVEVGASLATDLNPVADPTRNTGDEAKATDDVFGGINMGSNKGLATYQAPLDNQQIGTLFPEYAKDASSSAITIPAPMAIARIANLYGINQRVLLVLMSLLNRGGGPLFTSSRDFTTPYSTKDPGFVKQLVVVASDLQASRVKYDSLLHDAKGLPTSVTFFDKKYAVDKDANAESLALADFLSRTITDKKDFERAIYLPGSPDTSGIPGNQNFILTYELLYKVRPR